jgi:hypothetical protein
MTREQDTINRALGRIEGKIDGIDERLKSGSHRMEKLEDRVTANENRVWRLVGAAGVVSAITVIGIKMMPWAKLFA